MNEVEQMLEEARSELATRSEEEQGRTEYIMTHLRSMSNADPEVKTPALKIVYLESLLSDSE